MSRVSLTALALALIVASPAFAAGPRLRPLAPELASVPLASLSLPSDGSASTLALLGAATPDTRQQRRWDHALALLADHRPDEARGVLNVLAEDEPDLQLAPAWRIAAARAAGELLRHSDVVALLADPQVASIAEACAWRMRSLAALGAARPALAQLPCAKPALAARSPVERAPFLWAAASAALAIGRPDAALQYLRFAPASAPQAILLRAEALLRQGDVAAADRLLGTLTRHADGSTAAAAEALRIDAALALGTLKPAAALTRVETLLYRWRGDAIERRMAVRAWDLSLAAGKPRSGLAAAATLLRYHPAEPRLQGMLGIVGASFRHWLAPGSKVPLPLAAGLMWDYRDLLPNGPTGDGLVRLLADRLAGEGLEARAADLLEHQLLFRAQDLAQGPLSIDIAQLRLLAGQPDKALAVLRASDKILYPEPFASGRARLQAIALFQMGHAGEAVALLADVPGSGDLRDELRWRARDWEALAHASVEARGARFDEVTQVRILRQAIALAMIGDDSGLARLRGRYAAGFKGLPTASAFAALSGTEGAVDGTSLAGALAALPSVSPAGEDADLIDLSADALKARRAPPSSRG